MPRKAIKACPGRVGGVGGQLSLGLSLALSPSLTQRVAMPSLSPHRMSVVHVYLSIAAQHGILLAGMRINPGHQFCCVNFRQPTACTVLYLNSYELETKSLVSPAVHKCFYPGILNENKVSSKYLTIIQSNTQSSTFEKNELACTLCKSKVTSQPPTSSEETQALTRTHKWHTLYRSFNIFLYFFGEEQLHKNNTFQTISKALVN